MSITQTQRILDLALAGQEADQIAHLLDLTEPDVKTALKDLTASPSGQGVGYGGNQTVTGDLTVSGHFGVNGATAQAKSSAYTKTYSTQARTIPNATYAAAAVTSTQNATTVASDPTTTQALANALQTSYNAAQTDIAANATAVAALAADVLALKKLIVSLVVDLQAVGIAG